MASRLSEKVVGGTYTKRIISYY